MSEMVSGGDVVGARLRAASMRRRRRSLVAPAWFVLPAALVFAAVVLWPSVRSLRYAFTDWSGVGPAHSVGLSNFKALGSDPQAKAALEHTVLIAVVFTTLANLLGLGLALAVETRRRLASLVKAVIFLPAVLTPLITAYLWQFILSPDGSLNRLLSDVGLGSLQQPWLGEPGLALWSVLVVLLWQFVGFNMILYVAGLKTVPAELIEAAQLDGAGRLRRLWHVVLPQLAPAITINVFLSAIFGLRVFEQILVLTGGGPGYATQTLSTLVYVRAFQEGQFGYGAAMSMVLTGLVAIAALALYAGLARMRRA